MSQDLLRPVLENRLHFSRELVGESTVDQAMIEGQREIGDRANRDGVVDDHRHLFYGADSQDGYLRLVDYRRRENTAEAAEIGYGERSALHFIGLELAGARARRQIHDGALQSYYVLL